MGNEILIWTEGGPKVGMGHVVRSVNIACALRKTGLKPSFIINSDESSEKRLMMEGFSFLNASFDAKPSPVVLELLGGASVVVIDTKRDITKIVRYLKGRGIKVVLIDNSTQASGHSDMLILPSVIPYKTEEETEADSDRVFAGSDYLILGENFLKARSMRSSHSYALPLRVLVTFGGADPNDLTSMVIDALCNMKDLDITVVIGTAFAKRDPYAFTSGSAHVRCLSGLTDLAPVMSEAHIAFTANGTTIYELAFLGVPSLLIGNYETDLKEFGAYEELGFSKGLGLFSEITPETIQRSLAGFSSKDIFERSSRKAALLTDGLGAKRAAELVGSLITEE